MPKVEVALAMYLFSALWHLCRGQQLVARLAQCLLHVIGARGFLKAVHAIATKNSCAGRAGDVVGYES